MASNLALGKEENMAKSTIDGFGNHWTWIRALLTDDTTIIASLLI